MKDLASKTKGFFSVHPAILAVWAGAIAAGYLLPAFPILGTDGFFSLAVILNPLAGIFFGPIAGALCAAVGGFIGSLIAPHTVWLGIGTFIIGAVTAFSTGCIAWQKGPPVAVKSNGNFIINGGIIVYMVGTILWFTQETGRNVVILPAIFYGLGFIALITAAVFIKYELASKNKILKFLEAWLFIFSGLIGGATIGNFFFIVLVPNPDVVWTTLAFSAPIERAIFALVAALVCVPLTAGLKKIGIFVGPRNEDDILKLSKIDKDE
ncbi:MAG: hypothetical protein FWD13_02465 [Treponema sp.]|nr:hypothetical protein [Treponema sp.]